MVLEYRTIRIVVIVPVVALLVACNQPSQKAEAVGTAAVDSTVTCVSHGIPSRAAAIAESEKEHTFLGADDATMVYIKGGTFQMGATEFADASPVHEVTVGGFWMDEHEVTNAQFARFVAATGYQTIAERPLDPKAATFEDGYRVAEVVDTILRAARTGGREAVRYRTA